VERIMRWAALGVIVLLATSSVATAQTSGINLSWDNCGRGRSTGQTSCGLHRLGRGEQILYASFVAPAGVTLKSATLWLGLVSATPILPAWWTIGAPPSCRTIASAMTSSFTSSCASATDYWATITGGPFGLPATYIQDPAPGTPHMVPGSNHAGISAQVAVDNNLAYQLTEGQEYYLMTLTFSNSGSTTCNGCDTPVCILFNLVELTEPYTVLTGPPPEVVTS
jgi:hypothetical protein